MKIRGQVTCYNTKALIDHRGLSQVTSADRTTIPGSVDIRCAPGKDGVERCTIAFTDCEGAHYGGGAMPPHEARAVRHTVRGLSPRRVSRGRSSDGKWYTVVEWKKSRRDPYRRDRDQSVNLQVWDESNEIFIGANIEARPYPRAPLTVEHKSAIMQTDGKGLAEFYTTAHAIAAQTGGVTPGQSGLGDLPPIPSASFHPAGRRARRRAALAAAVRAVLR